MDLPHELGQQLVGVILAGARGEAAWFNDTGPAVKLNAMRNKLVHGWMIGLADDETGITWVTGRRGEGYEEETIKPADLRDYCGQAARLLAHISRVGIHIPGWFPRVVTEEDIAE